MQARGSIQKKGKVYYAVIAIGGKRKWCRGGPTMKDAQRVLNERQSEIDNGTYKEIPKITFKKFGEFWLQSYVEGNLKPSTSKGYSDIVKKRLSYFDERYLSEITTGQMQQYINGRKTVVKPKTVCNEVVVMKELFKHARKWGYIKINPAEDVDRPKLEDAEIEILEPHEIEPLLEKTHSHYRVAFLTAFLTGLRAGELWALKWSDVDWNSNKLFIRQSVWKGRFQSPKTKKSKRKVDITKQLALELKKWKLACPINENDLVFPGIQGGIANHVNVANHQFYPALRRAGLRQVSFHSLRHSNASMRIQAGQNIKYISEQLGHSTIRITMDIYGHLFNDGSFSTQQVELLEASLEAVRKPLETNADIADPDKSFVDNQLNLL
jgi:integrase